MVGTSSLALAFRVIGNLVTTGLFDSMGPSTLVFDETTRTTVERDLPLVEHVIRTVQMAAEVLLAGLFFFFLKPVALLGLTGAVLVPWFSGTGKRPLVPASIGLACAFGVMEFGGFRFIAMMSV